MVSERAVGRWRQLAGWAVAARHLHRRLRQRDRVLLEEGDRAAQRLEERVDRVGAHADVADERHRLHEGGDVVGLDLGGEAAHRRLHERLQLREAVDHRRLQVLGVRKLPLRHPRRQRLLHRLRVELQPAARRRRRERADVQGLAAVQVDLLVEIGERGLGRRRERAAERARLALLLRRALALRGGGGLLLDRHGLLDQKVLDGAGDVARPQMGEGGVRLLELVALERVVGGVLLDRVDVEAHHLVLDHFLEEVAVAPVEPLDEFASVEEARHPLVDRRLQAQRAARRRAAVGELGDVLHLRRVELEQDLDERDGLVLRDLGGVELLVEVLERVRDRAREAVDDDVVDELDVRLPNRGALRHLEHAVRREQQLGDLLPARLDLLVADGEVLGVVLLELLGEVRLPRLPRHQRVLGPLVEHALDRRHVRLDRHQRVPALLHHRRRLADELVDRVRAPREVLEPLLDLLVDRLQLRLQQRRLDVEHRLQHVVVLPDDQLQVADLDAVRLRLLEQLGGGVGDLVPRVAVGVDLADRLL